MLYRSTRGGVRAKSLEHVLFQGLAEDGGLYVPHAIPQLTPAQLQDLAVLPFLRLAHRIVRPFIAPEEVGDADLAGILERAFATFHHPAITPVRALPRAIPMAGAEVPSASDTPLYVLELFHGPTCAFKDVALQVLGQLFAHFQERRAQRGQQATRITVLGATSGDTGGAAIHGMRGKGQVQIFILHPKDRISSVQFDQMTSVIDPNVHNVAVEGTFDDCQNIVKALFLDPDFKARHGLVAINSINWARILAQVIYYFHAYYQVCRLTGGVVGRTQVRFSVPSGNFGDALAGYYAKRMGLPIRTLLVATNANDILHRFFHTGTYERHAGGGAAVAQTLSPAMDILISSNFERLAWYLARGDERAPGPQGVAEGTASPHLNPEAAADAASAQVRTWMTELRERGRFHIDPALFARSPFTSHAVNDADTSDAIRRYYFSEGAGPSTGYLLDPHTAVGVVAAERERQRPSHSFPVITVCLSTASPGKFPKAVLGAIEADPRQRGRPMLTFADIAPASLQGLDRLPKRCIFVPAREGETEDGAAAAAVDPLAARCREVRSLIVSLDVVPTSRL